MCVCLQCCKAVIDAGISVQIIKIISWLPSNSLSVLKNVSARGIWCIPISQRLKHPLQCTHISISIWHYMLPLHPKCPDSAWSHCQGNDYFCLFMELESKVSLPATVREKHYIHIDNLYGQSVLLYDTCTQFQFFPWALFLKPRSIFKLKQNGCWTTQCQRQQIGGNK